MRLKIDRTSLVVGSKFTTFALFFFVFEGNFSSTSPRGAYIRRRRFNGGFFGVTGLRGGGLIFGGAYTWRGSFSEFYSILFLKGSKQCSLTVYEAFLIYSH